MATLVACTVPLAGQGFGVIRHTQRIARGEGGFVGRSAVRGLGSSITSIGDLDGDGIAEVAVGCERQLVVIQAVGAVWIFFLRPDGTVRVEEGISSNDGGFVRGLEDGDRFGCSIAALGDVDGDGIVDLAVGSEGDDDGAQEAGAIRILFLNAQGTVRDQQKISATEGGLDGALGSYSRFGHSLAAIGDVDGDGTPDVAVAAPDDRHSSVDGDVFLLLLNPDGSVKSSSMIEPATIGISGFAGEFACSVTAPGDLDGDGRVELAVGAPSGELGGVIYVLFLDDALQVSRVQRISNSAGFSGTFTSADRVGTTSSALGDLDGDGWFELCTGRDPTPLIISLGPDGTARPMVRLDDDVITVAATPIMATLGDIDGDGVHDVAFGRPDETCCSSPGAVYVNLRCTSIANVGMRNPGGTNPYSLSIAPPALGAAIEATVDLSTTGHAAATIFGYAGSLTATLGGGQVLLMDVGHPSGELLELPLQPGPLVRYTLQVPSTLAVCGIRVSTQALHLFRVQPYALSNAVDLTLGPAGGGSL